jgi:5-formyltetrahydrofolate cyclo-ligase
VTARAGGAALRRRVRALRRSIDPVEREAADAAIVRHIRALAQFRSARRVAIFFGFDGEPDLGSLIRFDRRKEFFAPIIAARDMHFGRIGAHTELVANDFGIAEPHPPELIDPRALDLVLTPLVAFDEAGNRLGVGAGYYDRCFAFLGERRAWFRPKLIGTAYARQRVERMDPDPWDIPLWGIVTERGFERFTRS